MTRSLVAKTEIFIIVFLACVPLFLHLPYRVNIFLSWEGAYRMSRGQLPFRDFGVPLGGMYWVIPAIFFKIFGSGMITLQNMIIQCDGSRIQLTPAWPADWTADFKLHAPYNTTVEGHISNGKVTNLQVTPASRAKDVVIVKQ